MELITTDEWYENVGEPDLEEIARGLAEYHHRGQTDRSGVPYIEHVRAVARSPLLKTTEQRQAAWLHDILEDTACTRAELVAAGFSDRVLDLVDALTHRPNEPRTEYITRILETADARDVKMADNRHNLQRNSQLPPGTDRDRLRAKYTREWEWLTTGAVS